MPSYSFLFPKPATPHTPSWLSPPGTKNPVGPSDTHGRLDIDRSIFRLYRGYHHRRICLTQLWTRSPTHPRAKIAIPSVEHRVGSGPQEPYSLFPRILISLTPFDPFKLAANLGGERRSRLLCLSLFARGRSRCPEPRSCILHHP